MRPQPGTDGRHFATARMYHTGHGARQTCTGPSFTGAPHHELPQYDSKLIPDSTTC